MRFFRDGEGRDWLIDLGAETLARVQQFTGINLRHLRDGDVPVCFRDFGWLMETLWAILAPQAERDGVSKDAFEWFLIDRKSDARTMALISVASCALLREVAQLLPADKQLSFISNVAQDGIR